MTHSLIERREARAIMADILRVGELVLAAPRYNANLKSEIAKLQVDVGVDQGRVYESDRVIGDEERIALFALGKVADGHAHGAFENPWADAGRALLGLVQRKFHHLIEKERPMHARQHG